MDWDKLRIFHAAAEAGSFTHAGETLRMSQSAVSRQVSALEKELKVALFHRHARGLVLTEQGEMLFGTAAEIMSKLSTAETLLTDTTTKPSGDLRVTAPIGLGMGGKVKELASAVPLADVDSIEVKRLAVGKTITVTIRGVPFVLEVGAGANAGGVAEAFEKAKVAA